MNAIVITLFSLFFAASLLGQTHSLGITSGVNLARASGIANAGFRAGPVAGISYQLRFSNKFAFGANLIYDSRGGMTSLTYITDNGLEVREMSVPIVHDYVSLPLKIGMVSQGKFFGFGNAGIVPSYLLNAKHQSLMQNGELEWLDLNDTVRSFDLGVLLEGGVGLNLGERMLIQVAIAVQRGFLNVYDLGAFTSYVHQYAFTGALTCRYTFGAQRDLD